MHIQEATIHRLIKFADTSGAGSVTQQVRPTALPLDPVLTTLCTDLLALYATSANSNGTLGKNPTLNMFPVRLGEYTAGIASFQAFSEAALDLIDKEMQDAFFANGGYALFLRYQHDNSDFLLVAMLKLKPGAGIDEATLNLQPTLNIDLNLLHEAARINLTRMAGPVEPYLSFIRGKAKNGKVTDYFRKALSCENFTNSKHHTDQVMKAANAFVESRTDFASAEAKAAEVISMRKRLCECFASNAQEVVLPTLAAAVMPGNPQDFVDYVRTGPQASQYQINESFKPDKTTYARWKRLKGTMGSVSVAFDVDDVKQQRVRYDSENDSLILTKPSLQLVNDIKQYAATAAAPTPT